MSIISHSHNEGEARPRWKLFLKRLLCYAKSMVVLAAALAVLVGVGCQGRAPVQFDGQKAYEHVLAQVAFGPRPVGSEALGKTADYIESSLKAAGWVPLRVEGEYRGIPIRNIVAEKGAGGRKGKILIGAHYDTRPAADRDPDASRRGEPILGANDGASGVAVLLELARVFDPARCQYEVMLAFFDGEDRGGIDGWPFSVGADMVAERMGRGLSGMILVDMVGDADLQIYLEGNSDSQLAAEIWNVARRLGLGDRFVPEVRYTLVDDHVPFLRRGVPSVDIIDFDYPYWHTTADTADKVSAKSLEMVGRVLLEYLYTR